MSLWKKTHKKCRHIPVAICFPPGIVVSISSDSLCTSKNEYIGKTKMISKDSLHLSKVLLISVSPVRPKGIIMTNLVSLRMHDLFHSKHIICHWCLDDKCINYWSSSVFGVRKQIQKTNPELGIVHHIIYMYIISNIKHKLTPMNHVAETCNLHKSFKLSLDINNRTVQAILECQYKVWTARYGLYNQCLDFCRRMKSQFPEKNEGNDLNDGTWTAQCLGFCWSNGISATRT